MLILVLPNGIVTHVYGLISAWENHIGALNLSGLNGHLIALQPNIEHEWALGLESLYYSVYTDSIFPFHECVTHQHEPPVCGVLLEREVVESHTMSAMWNSVEWPYGGVTILFHIMQSKYYCKQLLNCNRIRNYTVLKQFCVVFFYLQLFYILEQQQCCQIF